MLGRKAKGGNIVMYSLSRVVTSVREKRFFFVQRTLKWFGRKGEALTFWWT